MRERALRVVLILVGLFFAAAVIPTWNGIRGADPNTGDTMQMAMYATLGVFLLLAARKPDAYRSSLMSQRRFLIAIVAVGVHARRGPAQATRGAGDPVGVWRGISSCQVRPSPCKDEIVVYRITRTKATDSITIDARKIVNAQEEDMGVLACGLAARDASLTCAIPNGVWRFTIRRDSLVGELRLLDGAKFRDVRAARSR